MKSLNDKPIVVVENQCVRCAGAHKLSVCTQKPPPYPWNVLGHPTVGVYIGPDKIEIGTAP